MYIGLHVKYPLYLLDRNELEFSRQCFPKNAQILHLMKIDPVGAEMFHADRRKDRHDEANNRFRQFCEQA